MLAATRSEDSVAASKTTIVASSVGALVQAATRSVDSVAATPARNKTVAVVVSATAAKEGGGGAVEAAVASIDAASPAASKRRRDGDTGLRLQRPPQAPSHRGCGAFFPVASHLEVEPPPEDARGTGHCDEERIRQALEELQQSRLATVAEEDRAKKVDDAWFAALASADRDVMRESAVTRALHLMLDFYKEHDPAKAVYDALRTSLEARLEVDCDWRAWADAQCFAEHGVAPGIASLRWRP